MLEQINNLSLFFEDCYREVSVREYSREMKISPPTASKMLKDFEKQGLLKKREERGFLFFIADRDSFILNQLSRVYWNIKLKKLLDYFEEFSPKAIVLFGSLSKLETRKESDIDLCIFGVSKETLKLDKFEKELKRKIQVFFYNSLNKVNDELKLNIINGHILRGYLS
jgi:predicted nucleotidyltransferase